MVSDDGQDTLDPSAIAKKKKKSEAKKASAAKGKLDINNMSHQQLEEQLKKMENMEE